MVTALLPALPQRQMLFTLPEVAVIIDRTPATVRRWVAAGLIPMHKVGGYWVIAREALVRWLIDLRRWAAAEAARWDTYLETHVEAEG